MTPPLPMDAPWSEPLTRTDGGRIWLANLTLDVRTGNLPDAVYAALHGALDAAFGGAHHDAHHDALTAPEPSAAGAFSLTDGAQELHLSGVVAVVSDRCADFTLRSPRAPQPEALSRVMDATSFGLYHLDPDLGEPLGDRPGERVTDLLRDELVEGFHLRGLMRTGRPYFWATTARAFRQTRPGGADALRDGLGLAHYAAGVHLIAIHIPRDAVAAAHVRAPTTLDAGDSPYFAPWIGDDGAPDDYGRTRDLGSLQPGLPEVVVSPMALDARFDVEALGAPSRDVDHALGAWVDAAEARLVGT